MSSNFIIKVVIRSFCVLCILVVGAAVFAGKHKPVTAKSRKAPGEPPPPTRVLMIGDSLSVAKFGVHLDDFLITRFKSPNVALYASCGSSPEDWLSGEPDYLTKCGYRERTDKHEEYVDWHNGKAPRRVRTPKVEDLLARHQPSIVIVQLGTNWMDGLAAAPTTKEPQYRAAASRFVKAVRAAPSVKRVVWITPPDSSRFSRSVQSTVYDIIRDAAETRVELIDSRRFTHYRAGVTGGDGVHYNDESSILWANKIAGELLSIFREFEAPARVSAN